MNLSIGIVGAGVGGLTLALCLKHQGLADVTVYEKYPGFESPGAGIQLSPNATRLLIALGLEKDLTQVAFSPQAIHLRSARSGFLVAQRPLGKFSETRYRAPYWHLHRADLHDVLRTAVQQQRIEIKNSYQLTDLSQTGFSNAETGPILSFTNGETTQHDIVIGCDGIRSKVREFLFPDYPPIYSGHIAWRGSVLTEKLPANHIAPTATAWMGPEKHFVHYYVRKGEMINFLGVTQDAQEPTTSSWKQEIDKTTFASLFADWHPTLSTLIENSDTCYRWPLYTSAVLPSWSSGRVALLGDAAHATLPYLAQGAALAIEDAWLMALFLERHFDQPLQAFVEYERYRKPRAERVIAASKKQGETFHFDTTWSIMKRNFAFIMGSRYLPEFAMQQFDWLHDYDALRGFE